jgi:hypothetical protein
MQNIMKCPVLTVIRRKWEIDEDCKIIKLQASDIPLGKTENVKQNRTNCGGSKSTIFYVAQNLQPCLKKPVIFSCSQRNQSRPRPLARFPYDPFWYPQIYT